MGTPHGSSPEHAADGHSRSREAAGGLQAQRDDQGFNRPSPT